MHMRLAQEKNNLFYVAPVAAMYLTFLQGYYTYHLLE